MESIERNLRRTQIRLNQAIYRVDRVEKEMRDYHNSMNRRLRRIAYCIILASDLASPIILSNEPKDEVKIEYKTERSY